MSDNQGPFGNHLEILQQALKMKEEGANQTQIREYLEEHGVQVKFGANDVGQNPGVAPHPDLHLLGPDRNKAEMFGFLDPIRRRSHLPLPTEEELLNGRNLRITDSKSDGIEPPSGVPQLLSRDEHGRPLPDKSMGETEYMRPEDRAALFAAVGTDAGQKAMEELVAALLPDPTKPINTTDFSDIGVPLSTDAQEFMSRREALLQDHLRNFPRGTGDLDPEMFKAPINKGYDIDTKVFAGFAPVFDAAVARRHLFKDLLKRLNAEVDAGPLKGILFFHSVLRVPKAQLKDGIEIDFSMKGTDFRHYNRLKAYTGYLLQLRQKYVDEILGAEAKVMERSDD